MVMNQVAQVISSLIEFYMWLIIAWCLLSWIPLREGSILGDISAALGRLVDPFIGLFRRFIPPIVGIDLSPVIAILILQGLQRLVQQL